MASYRRFRKVDITYVSSDTGSSALTNHINNRYSSLISSVGGPEFFEPVEMDIKFINKLDQSHFTRSSNTEFDLKQNLAKQSSVNSEYDWEAESSLTNHTTELKTGVSLVEMSIYMVIIEYTKIQEISE